MQEKWLKHKRWCVKSRQDLFTGKIELVKNSGVFIKKEEVLQTQ